MSILSDFREGGCNKLLTVHVFCTRFCANLVQLLNIETLTNTQTRPVILNDSKRLSVPRPKLILRF